MRTVTVVLAFILLPLHGIAQTPTDHECGAEPVARIGLVVDYVKHLPDGHTESGPGTAVGQWASAIVPNVSLGPQPVGFNLIFEDGRGADRYVLMSIWVEENYMQHRAGLEGADFATRDDVGLTISVRRKAAGGQYLTVSEKHWWVGSLAEIDQLRPHLEGEIEALHHFLITKLLPTRVSFKLSWHVYDAEDPTAPFFFIDAMEDSFGPIEPHPMERNFCFNLHFTHYDGTDVPTKLAVDEKEFWRYDLQEPIKTHVDKACEPREGYCTRPMATVTPYLTKGFGIYWDDRLETFDSDHRPITFLCPLDITPPSADTLFFGAPDRQLLPFRVSGLDGAPLSGVSMDVTRGVSAEFGVLSAEHLLTGPLGEPEGLTLTTPEDAPPEFGDRVEVAVCRDTPADQLGKDESGRPIPWTDTATQPVKIQVFPTVEVEIHAVHRLDRSEDMRVERDTEVSRELTRTETNQTLDLRFRVVMDEREVKRDYRDGSGFRGTLIQYRGRAEAQVGLASQEPSRETVLKSGYYQDRECGRLPFEFAPWTTTHTFRQTSDRVGLLVLYQHFIPDDASPVRDHPREGLSFVQRSMAPVVTYLPRSTDVEMDQDGCRLDFTTMRSPALQVPLQINEAFPILFAPYCDDCYGVEAVTVPLKEENSMSALLRRFDSVTQEFDRLERSVTIDLDRDATAECWSIPPDSRSTTYIPEGTRVKGLYTLSSQARLVGGRFDFRPEPPESP